MIPLSTPFLTGNEWKYVKECLDTGWVSSAGNFVSRFESSITRYTGSGHSIACMNGTAGLHLALQLTGVRRGDYVIAPNLTFVASINAIKYCGADPVLIDADVQTWQMDLDLLEDFLGSFTVINNDDDLILRKDGRRIRAVLPVHVLGNIGDMERLRFIADRFHLQIIEDATEALGSTRTKKHAGTFGSAGVFSFNGNKIITTGGGGMIVSDDEIFAGKARHLSTQAKADPDEYVHDEIGYNYRMTNVQAAIGLAQMEQLEKIIDRKNEIDQIYRQYLNEIQGIQFQKISDEVSPNCWLFTARFPQMRQLLKYLRNQQIETRPLWVPMNQLPMYENAMHIHRYDHAHQLYTSCISLPSSANLSEDDQMKVVQAIREFYQK